ncbi:MAG: hypothetical protein HZA52_01180 [Planctomycetes bacterium]|nr:hypothetical protein [Planctomycetota bacterium]
MPNPTSIALVAVATLASAADGSHVSVFVGESGKAGNIKVFDASGKAAAWPTGLQGIRLEPLDFGGRVALLDYQPGRPRRVDDVPKASRLLLPQGAGSLYRFSRAENDGTTTWGLMLVDADGLARNVWELAGDASGNAPMLAELAVAPAGDGLLVATTLAAGGDLWEIELTQGVAVCRTSAIAPLDFAGSGLALGEGFGVAVATTGILRFVRGASGDASAPAFANCAPPAWYGREVVLSANGAWAATIAGSASDAAHVYVFDGCHDAIEVDPTPQVIASAGFLPNHLAGPYLAVADDGSRAAWSVLEPTPELYLGVVPTLGAGSGVHVTHDALFHPFLDEIGLYGFLPTGKLHVGVGDRFDATLGGLTRMDVFVAGLAADGISLAVSDLSQSTGSSYPPFNYYPSLQADRVALSPDREWTVVYSNPTGDDGLVLVVPTDGHGVVPLPAVSGLEDIAFFELTDSHVVLGAERALANGEVEEVYHIPYGFFTQANVVMPLGDDDLGATYVRENGWAALATPDPQDGQWLWRVDLNGATTQKLTNRSFDYGPTLWIDAAGTVACSIGELDEPSLFLAWPPIGPVKRLQAAPMKGFVLPGS